MNVVPQGAHVNYFRTPTNVSFKKKTKINQIWKNYVVSQTGRVSQISNMERVKLINLSIQKAANLYYLQEKDYIKQYFYMNDQFDLFGKTYKYIFKGCQVELKADQGNRKVE